jgi:hypothetical protein
MGDILKEAIADAKAVRETALQNAKMALEEAFTPQLKSMLSAKLKEDEEGEEEVPVTDEDDEFGDEEVPAEEGEVENGEDDEVEEIGPLGAALVGAGTAKMVDGDEDPSDEDSEEHDEMREDDDESEDELDLESVIRELESELSEQEDEDEETVDEQDDAYDEKAEKEPEVYSEQDDAYDEKAEKEPEVYSEGEDEDDDTVEEEYEIQLENDDDDDDDDNGVEESKLQAELKEYKEAVHFLKDKLHEVNILNAKLLFTNKLFKSYSLDNNQKLKVVETFDRAQTTREIKLVYSTLAEQFNDNGSITTRKSIKESASAPVASTKPSKESKKVITEESQVANRFKKLAGLIK